jgi:hypothetical protein
MSNESSTTPDAYEPPSFEDLPVTGGLSETAPGVVNPISPGTW